METISLMSMNMMEFERGPRYHAYAQLRETKLRMRNLTLRQEEYQEEEEEEEVKVLTQRRNKQVKFQGGLVSGRKGLSSSSSSSSSLVAQSVPDFSSVLRKENKKPMNGGNMLPPLMELTPPSKSGYGSGSASASARGSKSANAGEKRRGGAVLMPRKSYASIDELKSFSSANTANAHNNRPRTTRLITRKTLLGYTHI